VVKEKEREKGYLEQRIPEVEQIEIVIARDSVFFGRKPTANSTVIGRQRKGALNKRRMPLSVTSLEFDYRRIIGSTINEFSDTRIEKFSVYKRLCL